MLYFRKLPVTKKFVVNTCVLCFRKFPVAKKFMDRKGGGGAECQDFPSKIFLCRSAEIFRR